jgi:hypothetical protein
MTLCTEDLDPSASKFEEIKQMKRLTRGQTMCGLRAITLLK